MDALPATHLARVGRFLLGEKPFKALSNRSLIAAEELPAWNAIIGLRNRIVHDYMNIDLNQITALIVENREQFVVRFLLKEFDSKTGNPA